MRCLRDGSVLKSPFTTTPNPQLSSVGRNAWIIASLFGSLSTLSLFMENAILQVESEHTNQLEIASVVDTLK